MAHILVTGSTDGLGRATAETLLDDGHRVTVHARNRGRASAVADLVERGAGLVVADLADRDEVLAAVDTLAAGEPLDGVVHNAGVLSGRGVIPVNVVAPYLFTALLPVPTRHVYLSSGMHRGGRADLGSVDWSGRTESNSYSDTKLFVTALSAAIAERWPDVQTAAVDPGWVPTKMGGRNAPDDFTLGHRTQERLVTGSEGARSGAYWFHGRQQQPHPAVSDPRFRQALLDALASATGVTLPAR